MNKTRYAILLGIWGTLAACGSKQAVSSQYQGDKQNTSGSASEDEDDATASAPAAVKPSANQVAATPALTPAPSPAVTPTSSAATTPAPIPALAPVAPVPALAPPQSPPPAPQLAVAQLTPIYRLFGIEHLFSTSQTEGGATMHLEGTAFYLLSANLPGSVALLRCRAGDRHFLTTQPQCEGHAFDGILGYLFPTARPLTAAITRCVSANGLDHLVVYDPQECRTAGYNIEALLGWTPLRGYAQ